MTYTEIARILAKIIEVMPPGDDKTTLENYHNSKKESLIEMDLNDRLKLYHNIQTDMSRMILQI